MNEATFVPVGRVVKAHGLRGEISVLIDTGDPQDLIGLMVWFTPPPETVRSGTVISVRQGPKGPLLTISDVDDVDIAATLAGHHVVVAPSDLPRSFVSTTPSVTGFEVIDEERGRLGTVEDVIRTGANDVWVVQGGIFGEVLIPVIDDVVLDTDVTARSIRVRLLPGLLDEE